MLSLPFTKSPLLSTIPRIEHGFSNLQCDATTIHEFSHSCATAHQVHKDDLLWVEQFEKAAHQADGIGTEKANLPVGVFTADCSPLLFAATNREKLPLAILAVHAGWRGTALKIAEKALLHFATKSEALGAQKIFIAIGPSISKKAFEVGQEVVDAFPEAEKNGIAQFLRIEESRRKYLFDLPGENERQLKSVKISLPLEIDTLPDCTFFEAARYPSFRREKSKCGRILSFLAIR